LKVKQNGFEMFKTNPHFRRAIGRVPSSRAVRC
jgi:hypothetical protein